MASAVTALVEYGPDYIKMDRPTPPLSDVSFNTYMVRFQNFIHNLAALPWVATERVTVDYYPTSAERLNNRLPHRPLITWHSKDYSHADYHLDSDSIDSLTLKMTPRLQRLKAPSHASRIDINLDSEFSDRTRSPFPYHPPNIIQTPDHRRPRSEGFKEVGYPSLPQASKSPLPPSSVQRQWEDPSFNPIQPYVPNWGNAPDTLPLFPPNSGQTPMMYPEESRPESRTDTNTNALLQTPAAQKFGLSYTEGPETLSGGGTYGEDPRLRSQNDANVTFFSTPTRPRPASVRSNRRWESTPKPDYLASPKHTLPSHRYPDPGSGQYPISGSPSRRSRKSSSAGSQPGGESTEAWENFPQDRPGFVPFEYSENYYGTRYGVGIHGLLPPVGRVSNDASADASPVPSIKQPQPQYPKPTLVTPPSQASSL
jgi:hypothetical protein